MQGKAIVDLSVADLEALVANGVAESRMIDYKLALPGTTDADKKEFLADVTAMANTDGGCILYGVETRRDVNGKDSGIPAALPGLAAVNLDREKLRLASMLQDSVSPPLRGSVVFQDVTVSDSPTAILALGIPRSLLAPHRVIYEKSNKFWRRSESGKYEPDVTELRRLFLRADSWGTEIEKFRRERAEQIRNRRMPVVDVSSSAFFHVLPLGRLDQLIDLRPHHRKLATTLAPPRQAGWDNRYNVDGFMTYSGGTPIPSYTQWFRFGGIEGYSSHFVKLRSNRPPKFEAVAMSIAIENYVREAVVALHEVLEQEPPYAVGVSLYGINTAVISLPTAEESKPIDQDEMILPLVILEEFDPPKVRERLRPLIDTIWQAGGLPGEPNTTWQ
jgi:hypothetical protein